MSNTVSALNGASAQGFVQIRDMGLQGMITLRGDLSASQFKKGVFGAIGGEMPGPGQINVSDGGNTAWMSPDELLIVVPYPQVKTKLDEIASGLGGVHHLAVDVSDARCMFSIAGEDALVREALAKLMPVDFSPEAFKPGQFRRSRMAQVAAAVWMAGEGEARVVCFRSVAQYVFDLLKGAAAPGSEVRYL
ncbi:sarcosine oxidase subunit gamma [Roseovarius nanhaiticus]|uniref:Sarcosine oxidase subunit gamma n=1 Tax=Roseovarius nanhaiticus TaxID=573024 RepID=A0A1N7GW31_9RHOB|nr:sarcosine oxidase subunit gamma family protein [Roseovarius nanhaiticus]SEL32309.1 sarcosine oxidase subunit gamma [Roseovarius nanhaiticus]SIS16795.1 sarcosine oxidase subunit gamma [Roseovarius nanhaiticus]